MPADTPDTRPEAFTVATAALLPVQLPPVKPLEVSAVVVPAQIVFVPEIVPALGNALTVTVEVVDEEQPLAETL